MNDRFLRVCRGETVDRPPVWLMRQAGRYLPEYRAIRQKVDFLTLCRTADLTCEVTLQPVDILGVDAAIIFADILLPLDAMGAELEFVKGDGPVFRRPVRRIQDLDQLHRPDVEKELGYVFEALRVTRRALDGRVPLIGFAGTPWTLAAYLVEGGTSKSFAHLLAWSYRDPDGLRRLLDLVAEIQIEYLLGQIDAGAQALQLFDTWGGLLDPGRFREVSRPSIEKILEAIGDRVPRIYYSNGTVHLLDELATLPVEALSVDWRLPLAEVRRRVGAGKVLQGNLDPGALLGAPEELDRRIDQLLSEGAGGGHVVNLGHGILPMTPVENARRFVSRVQAR